MNKQDTDGLAALERVRKWIDPDGLIASHIGDISSGEWRTRRYPKAGYNTTISASDALALYEKWAKERIEKWCRPINATLTVTTTCGLQDCWSVRIVPEKSSHSYWSGPTSAHALAKTIEQLSGVTT